MEKKVLLGSTDPETGYVRVSSILQHMNNFSGIDEDVLERKKNIGSSIHLAIDMHSRGLAPILPEEARGYMDSFREWLVLTGFELLKCELRLYDKTLKITGCVDAIVVDPSTKKNFIVDFKCTYAANLDYWQHQGAFYHHLATLNSFELCQEFHFVQLNKTGNLPRVHKFTMSEHLWRQCLKLYYSYMSTHKT